MTAATDQFVDIAKQSQEAVSAAFRTWADAVQNFAGGFTGAYVGLYATSNGRASANHADFAWFEYTPLRPER